MPANDSPRLVALAPETRAELASWIVETWTAGDAVLPLDPGLEEPERRRLVERARPDLLRDRSGTRRLDDPEPSSRGTALVLPTAGSTGAPKLVELSRAALDAAARASNERLGAKSGDGWLCTLPLGHIAGVGILGRAAMTGSPVRVQERFDPGDLKGAAFTSVVPTMLVRLLDAGVDLRGFKAILLGGARIPEALLERARDAGANVVTTYGMTETCGGVVYDGVPLDGVSFSLTAEGVIRLSGLTLMTRYRGDPAATGEALVADGFLTRDRGRVTSDERLEVLGRIDDVIVSGGEKIDPAEVEAVLEQHPAVVEALVIGEPDDEWGERVIAQVVASDWIDLAEVRAFIRHHLAPYKVPREVRVVEELPRLPSGKPKRR
jgi:O-succinylbenzoic acid--CoA ligase